MAASTIDFEALRYLLVSAEVGTLSRAADTPGIETASLSRRLHRIEDELGLTLFERGHDGIRLVVSAADRTSGSAMEQLGTFLACLFVLAHSKKLEWHRLVAESHLPCTQS